MAIPVGGFRLIRRPVISRTVARGGHTLGAMRLGRDYRAWCVLGTGTDGVQDVETRRARLIALTAWSAACVSVGFMLVEFILGGKMIPVGFISGISAVGLAVVPFFSRLGPVIASTALVTATYLTLTALCVRLGTDTGLQFYFFIVAGVALMIVGIERARLAIAGIMVGAATVVVLQFEVPRRTGVAPDWLINSAFVVNTVAACVLALVIVGIGLRQIARAEAALENEYDRSEALLANILPSGIAERLKGPARGEIADRYDDASILFADIAGFTAQSSTTSPTELVRFLDRLYSALDDLVDRHGLEKIKTTGDSYMVVSGVPQVRTDHARALARFALEMVDVAATVAGLDGGAVPLRIGIASGPVVAGVVGSKKFFYDVWGDAVNLASRMESTGEMGRIQVAPSTFEQLSYEFELEERGMVDVKGKGALATWFLLRESATVRSLR